MDSSKATNSDAAIVVLDKVQVRYGESGCALDVDTLRINRGERVFVLGKSGSGKTTLARTIKGRLRPSSGTVRVLNGDPSMTSPTERRELQGRIAMIDQEFHLVPRMTVINNVLCGSLGRVSTWLNLFGWYPQAEWDRAASILAEVELDAFGGRRVETLSGGQRQRCAIARALMQESDLILADEPISNLDPELAEDALELLVACAKRRDDTLIVNLHQPRLARRFATRVLGLYEGRIVFDGPPEELSGSGEEFIYHGNGGAAKESNEAIRDDPASTVAT